MSTGAFLGALTFAVSAGIATFFAPCAFPLLPGYIGYYLNQQEQTGITRALGPGVAAASGVVVVFAIIGAIVFTLGRGLVGNIAVFEPIIGAGLIGLGLLMLSGRTPELRVMLPARPTSIAGFVLFGAVYAIAAAGCVVPVFIGVVGQALTLPPAQGGAAFVAYAASIALPLVGVTLLAGSGIDAWRDFGRYTDRFQQVAAGLMVLAGIGQLYLSIVVLDVL
jgi:cytochrome c-type biogenesis protein